jgi:hypothetical protein
MGRIDDALRMAQPSAVSPMTRLRRSYMNMVNERDMLPAEASPESVTPPPVGPTGEMPKAAEQVAGGMLEGASQTLQTLNDIGLPFFGEMAKQIPYIPKEDGAALNLVRSISRFGTVAIPAMMATGSVAGGMIADFVSTPPDEENISAVLRKAIPELEGSPILGPLTKVLATDPGDAPALNRFRNVLEGGVLGSLIGVVTHPKKAIDALVSTADEMRKLRGPLGTLLRDETGAVGGVPKPPTSTQQVAKDAITDFEKFRRPGTPIPQSVAEGLSYDRSIQHLVEATPQTAYTREELVAIKSVEQTYASALKKARTPEEFVNAVTDYKAARRVFLGGRAEAGGSTMMLNTSPAMNDPTSQFLDHVLELHASGVSFETTQAMLRSLPDDAVAPFIAEVAERQSTGKALKEALLEAYVFTRLSLKSASRAFFGTGTMIPLTLGERWMAGTIGNSAITRGEVYASLKAMYDTIPKALDTWMETMKNPDMVLAFSRASSEGVYTPKITADAFGATGALGAFIDGLGHVVRGVGRPLLATDMMFKELAKSGETHALAWRRAVQAGNAMRKQGLSENRITHAMSDIYNQLVKNPPKDLSEDAEFFARMVTLTDQFGAVPGGKAFDHMAASAVKASNDYMLFKFFAPFLRNNLRSGLAVGTRIPIAGRIFSDTQDQLLRGTPEGEAIRRGKDAIGVGLLGLTLWMAHEGRITGAPPKDPRLRAEWEGQGFTPHSLIYSFDKNGNPSGSISIRGTAAPLTEIFGSIASLYHAYKWTVEHEEEVGETEGNAILSGLLAAADGIAEVINDDVFGMTFLRLLTDISRGNDPTKWAIDSLTPSIVKDMANAFAPYRTRIDNAMDSLKNVSPWHKAEVPAARGFLGERFTVGATFFEDEARGMFPDTVANVGIGIARNASPTLLYAIGDEQSRAVYAEIRRVNPKATVMRPRTIGSVKVNEEVGNTFMAIRGGETIERNGRTNRPVTMNGKNLKTFLYDLITSETYKNQPIGVKDMLLETYVANFSNLATIELKRLYPEIEQAEREAQRYELEQMTPRGGR